MSGRRDVKVVFIEVSELCCATKVNDKQIIFCNNFRRRPRWQDEDEPPGSTSPRSWPSSVPRRLSTGADAEAGCFRIVAAVAVDSSNLLDFLLIDEPSSSVIGSQNSSKLKPEPEVREGGLYKLAGSGQAAAWSDCSDDSGSVRLVLGSAGGESATEGSTRKGTRKNQGLSPRVNFRRATLGSDYFEQFCVKCRIYLLENFQKFRSNFSIMSRVSILGANNVDLTSNVMEIMKVYR